MAYLFDVNTESTKRIFGESISSPSSMIQIDCNIDNGCFDQGALTFYDPMGHAPEVFFERRSAPNSATGGLWRHFTAKVSNAEGRKPLFKISRQYRDGNGTHDLSRWRCVYTQDFSTWVSSDPITLAGGSTGSYNFSFPNTLPAGDVVIAHNLYGRQQEADAFASWLLATHSAIASPTQPEFTNGVYVTSTVENGDLGQPVGGLNQYAIKLAFGGSTTDGKRKRKAAVISGIHSAGEAQSWWAFYESIYWIVTSADIEAQNLRANFDFYIYFNLNANGIKAGTSRMTPRSSIDPNRAWSGLGSVSHIIEIDQIKRRIYDDVGGTCDAFFTWHGDVYKTNDAMTWLRPNDFNAGTRRPVIQALLTAAQARYGYAADISITDTNNTDLWFAEVVLGTTLYFNVENPSMSISTRTAFARTGQIWMASLSDVDQQGYFFSGSSVTLIGDNTRSANRSNSGAITKSGVVVLSGDSVRVANRSTSGGMNTAPVPVPMTGGHFGGTAVIGGKKRNKRKDISSKRNDEIRLAIDIAINGERPKTSALDLADALGGAAPSAGADINMILLEVQRLKAEMEADKQAREEEELLMRLL